MNVEGLSVDPHQVLLGSVLSEKHIFEVRFCEENVLGVQHFEEPTTGPVHEPGKTRDRGSSFGFDFLTVSLVQL